MRNLWRKIWLESAQQVAGGANRQWCQSGKGFQSARGTAGSVWKWAQTAGQPAKTWRSSSPKHCSKTLWNKQKGIMEGLRNFIEVVNHIALDVAIWTRSFEVRRPKCKEEGREVSFREGPEELTLRTEEVRSKKSCANVDHIAQDRWRPLLVDADWHAFCQAMYEGIEGRGWEELYDHCKEMSRAARVKKPKWKPKSESPLKIWGSHGQRSGSLWPRTQRQKRDWNDGKSTSKTRLWRWIKHWSAWRIRARVFLGPRLCAGFLQRLWEKPIWECVWPCLDPWDCVYAQRPWSGMCQGSMGRMASSFFLPD